MLLVDTISSSVMEAMLRYDVEAVAMAYEISQQT
jgi:hypothetical protein